MATSGRKTFGKNVSNANVSDRSPRVIVVSLVSDV